MNREELQNRLLEEIREAFGDKVQKAALNYGMPEVVIDPSIHVDLARWLKEHQTWKFVHFTDITAVDHYGDAEHRFEVVVHLHSLEQSLRVRIKVPLEGDEPELPTLTDVFIGASWPEREVFDLMGITFTGHPRMTRILSPDDFEGHPLRKDFPVKGTHRGSFPRGTIISNKRREPAVVKRTKPEPADHVLPPTPLEQRRAPMRGEQRNA